MKESDDANDAFYAAYQRCEEANGAIMVAARCANLRSGVEYLKGYLKALQKARALSVLDDEAKIVYAVLSGQNPALSPEQIQQIVGEGEAAHLEMQRLLRSNNGFLTEGDSNVS